MVNLQSEADRHGVLLPINEATRAQEFLDKLNKKKRKLAYVSDAAFKRYRDAKLAYETVKFPNWIRDGHFNEPDRPKEDTNGLTGFCIDFLTWSGHFANRTGNEGRVLKDGTRIKSSSKLGMQDIDSNLKHSAHRFGIPWKIEIKAGKDTHKDHQKEYGKQVAVTGGVYSVVRNADDLLDQYDKLMVGNVEQSSIFV